MLISLTTGTILYLYQGYTYCKGMPIQKGKARRWICSQHKNCKVYVHLDNSYTLVTLPKIPHNHPPPNIRKLKDGSYLRTPPS